MRKFVSLLIVACLIAAGCDTREDEVYEHLKEFSERVQRDGENFTIDDWDDAMDELDGIHYDLKFCNFSEEKWREIGEIEGRTAVMVRHAAYEGLDNEFAEFRRRASGFSHGYAEGLKRGVQEGIVEEYTPEEMGDGVRYELAKLENKETEQIVEHLAYTVSYNDHRHIPNWVAYELTRKETEGEVERGDDFVADPLVTGDVVQSYEYKGSGYDRGHMAPAADMKWSEQAMKESFYMSNICPQNSNNNRGDWKQLEELARDWAAQYGSIFICCGPVVENEKTVIGEDLDIVVPQAFFKVFLRREGERWYAIGFVMQNVAQSKPLMTYGVSVDEVEKMTGIDFFYQLPDELERVVEADFDFADWTVK